MITDFYIVLPAVLHTLHVFAEYQTIIDTYLLKIFKFFGIVSPMRMFRSVILLHLMGVEYQHHYRQFYPELDSHKLNHEKVARLPALQNKMRI